MQHRDPETPDIDGLVEELRARVEERRKAGIYPPELEEELDQHFQRIAAHRPGRNLKELQDKLDEVREAMSFDVGRFDAGSKVPGGRLMHRLVARITARQTQSILDQVHLFAAKVDAALEAMRAALERPSTHVHPDLLRQVDAILERLAFYERSPVDSGVSLRDLRRRLELLEAAEARRKFRPFYSRSRFREEFQGSDEEYAAFYKDLAARFKDHSPVLDLGCGNGRFLRLLREQGIEARGVDVDPEPLEEARSDGLEVEEEDLVRYLGATIDASVGGVALIQVVEHLTSQELVQVVALLADKVRPQSLVVAETVNPKSLSTFGGSLYLDPTHIRPVHPAYLSFLFREAGFSQVEIEWRAPLPDEEILEESPKAAELGAEVNRNVERLNQLLYAPQNYALIAIR